MQPIHFNPPESLMPYIAFYGVFDIDEGFSEPYVSPPLGFCGFIICLHDSINAQLNGKLFMKDRFCATGQVTAPMVGDVKGKNKILMVFIHPCGLHQFFGINMSMLTNTSMPLSELLGEEECTALIAQLNGAADNEKIIHVMNEFFLSQLPVFEIAPKVSEALEYIHRHKGNVSVKDIEANCYITPRTLERHFKVYIGLSPKEYAKIFRFKCLVNFINQHPGVTWATLCEQNGYYDQAHLTRNFIRYMNMKHTDMVKLDTEYINYLLQET
ncbi:MAG: AraC family transcriptional regulator [Bacteroidota bacterium]|nr:AraC family transcriptional regulator [Bacteroidota bacterium]